MLVNIKSFLITGILSLLLCLNLNGQGNAIFDNAYVHIVKLTSLHASDWDSMVRRYTPKIYTPLKVEIDGTLLDSVGVRIKGNSFYPPTMGSNKYQPFRLKFGKFKSGRRFDGLKDVNLHMHDLLTNFLGYDIWRKCGLVAPRTSFAKVYFDNLYLGMYMFVDEVDKIFLDRHYGNDDGNLFKADEKMANLSWLGWDQTLYGAYTLETNEDKNDKSDLIAFLYALHHTPEQLLLDSLRVRLNMDAFFRSMAIEMFICKRDAFYDSGHNYFLYHNTETARFEYIPWDLDNSFQSLDPFNLNFVTNSGMMGNPAIQKIMNVPALKNYYYQCVCNLINSSACDPERLLRLMDETEAFLRLNSLSFSQISGYSLAQVRTFISARTNQIITDFGKYGFSCNPVNSVDKNLPVNSVSAYPNPCEDVLYIHGITPQDKMKYRIVDMKGRDRTAGNFKDPLNIAGLENGLFFLILQSQKGSTHILKFLKN